MHLYLIILLAIFAAFLAAFSQFLFKKNIQKINSIKSFINLIKNKFILFGLLFYGVSLIIYLFALKVAQDSLSIVYSLFATVFIFVSLFSFFLLKEKLNSKRILGITLIFIGIIIISITIK
ncbi:MAG: small multidrug resistance protein [Candidatus Marsarchaeota archaeon]|nr:small multidrug resistance protein [Candidatus Marsarchaeota archaeon]MCL5094361.1 small multidrug resistance protein [Candidatus Marsarchaeota archaeon]